MLKNSIALLVFSALASQAIADDTVRSRFPNKPHSRADTYTRMFNDLPPFAAQTEQMRNNASQLGAKGGLLDAQDDLSDPLQSIIDPARFSPNNPDNPEMTAGATFVGQFLDHDITFDRRSALRTNADPSRTVNFRSAAFDLDHIYGEGPEASPELYDRTGTDILMRIEAIPGSAAVSRNNFVRYDLPRDQFGEAIMGDSRNDENVIVSQLHLAMLRFHNTVSSRIRASDSGDQLSATDVFERTKRQVQWHYQWIILNEFLPNLIGQERIDQIFDEGLPYWRASQTKMQEQPEATSRARQNQSSRQSSRDRSSQPKIPVEFSAAAYRFGHTQVRPSYRLNFGADDDSQFFAFVLDNRIDPNAADPGDLRGGRRAPRRFVDWQTFFDFGDGNVRNNKLIDSKISTVLFELPGAVVPAPGLPSDGVISLASRNLIRHVNFGLPAGQEVARAINVPALTDNQLIDLAPFGMAQSTPLWVYILKEAELLEDGFRLGPVGARIVGEVFIGLLSADEDSYVAVDPQWRPNLPSRNGAGQFDIVDLLNLAGVVTPIR